MQLESASSPQVSTFPRQKFEIFKSSNKTEKLRSSADLTRDLTSFQSKTQKNYEISNYFDFDDLICILSEGADLTFE